MKGENPCGIMTPQNTEDWGQAGLWIPKGYIIKGYDAPNGIVVDSIYRHPEFGNLRNFYYGDSINFGKELAQGIKPEDNVWVGHSTYTLLKINEERDGFYKILSNTIQGGIWVSIVEITGDKRVFKYRDLLLGDLEKLPAPFYNAVHWESTSIGVNLVKSCLKLRAEPSTNGKEYTCIPGNDWTYKTITHLKIQEVKGDWAYVHVITEEYTPGLDDSGEGCDYKITNEQDGWVKAIDDKGFPNIWYSVTSY